MRKLTVLFLTGVAAMVSVSAGHAQESSTTSSARIGTFDSRVIATAFYRSAEFQESFRDLMTEFEEAKASGDEWRVKELEAYGPAMQHRMHQQGISTASVREIMEKISDALPEIAASFRLELACTLSSFTLYAIWSLPSGSNPRGSRDVRSLSISMKLPSSVKSGIRSFADILKR